MKNLGLTAHGVEKLRIVFGGLDFVEQEFHRFQLVHRVEQFAQQPDPLQDIRQRISNSSLRVPERLTLIAG